MPLDWPFNQRFMAIECGNLTATWDTLTHAFRVDGRDDLGPLNERDFLIEAGVWGPGRTNNWAASLRCVRALAHSRGLQAAWRAATRARALHTHDVRGELRAARAARRMQVGPGVL